MFQLCTTMMIKRLYLRFSVSELKSEVLFLETPFCTNDVTIPRGQICQRRGNTETTLYTHGTQTRMQCGSGTAIQNHK